MQQPNIVDTACRFAWDYPIVNVPNMVFRNCCRALGGSVDAQQLRDLGPELFDRHPDAVRMKMDLLRGIRTPACKTCWDIESKGGISARGGFDDFVEYVAASGHFGISSRDDIKQRLLELDDNMAADLAENLRHPRMVELNLGNTCDLKCLYCGPKNSTQWAAELHKHGELADTQENSNADQVRSDYEHLWWLWLENHAMQSLKNISFLGGEPLIIDRFYDHVLRINDIYAGAHSHTSVTLTVVSNLNTPEAYVSKFIDLINRVLDNPRIDIELIVSCESYGDRAAFIRTGTNWPRFERNIKQLAQLACDHPESSRISMRVLTTLNILCISDLPNFYSWFVDINQGLSNKMVICRNQAVYPHWLNPMLLSEDYVQYIRQGQAVLQAAADRADDHSWLQDGGVSGQHSYLDWLDSIAAGIAHKEKNQWNRRQFARQIDIMCERRDLNFARTFPEMIDFYNLCKDAE